MRKIVSKEVSAKKRRRNQVVVGLVLVMLMLLSTLGYAFQSFDGNRTITYNGREFVEQGGTWFVQFGIFQFAFSYNPKQVSPSTANLSTLEIYYNEPVYIYSESLEARNEVEFNLNQVASIIEYACVEEENCEWGYVIDCTDTSVIIRLSETSSIRQEEKCLIIESPQQSLVRNVDSALFKIIGI